MHKGTCSSIEVIPSQQICISGVAPIVHRHHSAVISTPSKTVAAKEVVVVHVDVVKDQLDGLVLLHLDGPATGEVVWERPGEVGTLDGARLSFDEAVPAVCERPNQFLTQMFS